MNLARAAFHDELQKLAYHTGCVDDGEWYSRFSGSPVYTKALELAEKQLKEQESFDAERVKADTLRKSQDDLWKKEDALRSKHRAEQKGIELEYLHWKIQERKKVDKSAPKAVGY